MQSLDSIPNEFVCPLTLDVMVDPVMDKYGHCYERSAILAWVNQGNMVCPLTRRELKPSQLVRNSRLKKEIDAWRCARLVMLGEHDSSSSTDEPSSSSHTEDRIDSSESNKDDDDDDNDEIQVFGICDFSKYDRFLKMRDAYNERVYTIPSNQELVEDLAAILGRLSPEERTLVHSICVQGTDSAGSSGSEDGSGGRTRSNGRQGGRGARNIFGRFAAAHHHGSSRHTRRHVQVEN